MFWPTCRPAKAPVTISAACERTTGGHAGAPDLRCTAAVGRSLSWPDAAATCRCSPRARGHPRTSAVFSSVGYTLGRSMSGEEAKRSHNVLGAARARALLHDDEAHPGPPSEDLLRSRPAGRTRRRDTRD